MSNSSHADSGRAEETNTLVIGAGPGGLSVAGCLAKANIPYIVLEQSEHVGIKWRQHYDRLHLHTAKQFSALPYRPFPQYYDRYPSRQQVVRYLDDYATFMGIRPRFNVTVESVKRNTETDTDSRYRWRVVTTQGEFLAENVVVATGYNRVPFKPDWPGLDGFSGQVMHSAEYKNGRDYAGKSALVVGFGNSGAEIALDLWEHSADTALSVRSPVNVLPREILGIPTLAMGIWQRRLPPRIADQLGATTKFLIGDLSPYGLRQLERGPMEEITQNGRVPMLDVGTIPLIKQRKILVYPGIDRFEGKTVVFTDGRRLDVDLVVLATGYRPRVNDFLEVDGTFIDEQGTPKISGGESANPGLYFCGYFISPAGMFREMALEAKQISAAIARA